MPDKAHPVVALVFGLAGAALLVSLCGLVVGIGRKLAKNYPRQYPAILRITAVIGYILAFTWATVVLLYVTGHVKPP